MVGCCVCFVVSLNPATAVVQLPDAEQPWNDLKYPLPPKNIDEINNLADYVSLKIDSLGV